MLICLPFIKWSFTHQQQETIKEEPWLRTKDFPIPEVQILSLIFQWHFLLKAPYLYWYTENWGPLLILDQFTKVKSIAVDQILDVLEIQAGKHFSSEWCVLGQQYRISNTIS